MKMISNSLWKHCIKHSEFRAQSGSRCSFLLVFTCFLHCGPALAADFSVTSPGSFYSINGSSANPTLTLQRGKTYTFSINTASSHPFLINSTGVINNNIHLGTITYTVPLAASNYTYECSIHGFGGSIITT